MMTVGMKLRTILRIRKLTVKQFAQMIGTSPENLQNKLRRDNFAEKDIREFAKALGCRFEPTFIFEDTGEKI